MQPPDSNALVTWATAIATIIVLVRQQLIAWDTKSKLDENTQITKDTKNIVNGTLTQTQNRVTALEQSTCNPPKP